MTSMAPFVQHLSELYSREEKKSKPIFYGTGDETMVTEWQLKQNEAHLTTIGRHNKKLVFSLID